MYTSGAGYIASPCTNLTVSGLYWRVTPVIYDAQDAIRGTSQSCRNWTWVYKSQPSICSTEAICLSARDCSLQVNNYISDLAWYFVWSKVHDYSKASDSAMWYYCLFRHAIIYLCYINVAYDIYWQCLLYYAVFSECLGLQIMRLRGCIRYSHFYLSVQTRIWSLLFSHSVSSSPVYIRCLTTHNNSQHGSEVWLITPSYIHSRSKSQLVYMIMWKSKVPVTDIWQASHLTF